MLPMDLPETRPPPLKGRPQPKDGEPWCCAHCGDETPAPRIWVKRVFRRKTKIGLCLDCDETLLEAQGHDDFGAKAGPREYLMPLCPFCGAEMTRRDLRIMMQQGDHQCCSCRGVEGLDWADEEAT